MKNKSTIIITISTIVLAGIAVFTALRLYQLRDESVAPTAPESEPAAQTSPTTPPVTLEDNSCESITFTLAQDEPTPTPTATTRAQTPTPTATTPGQTAQPTPTSTSTPVTTATSPPLASGPTSTPAASLPPAGYATPTIVGIGAGLVILVFSILLAL